MNNILQVLVKSRTNDVQRRIEDVPQLLEVDRKKHHLYINDIQRIMITLTEILYRAFQEKWKAEMKNIILSSLTVDLILIYIFKRKEICTPLVYTVMYR